MDRYTTRTLRSGAVAILDTEDRNRVALIGTITEVYDFLGEYDAYLSDSAAEEAAELAYNLMLENRAERGSWWGHD